MKTIVISLVLLSLSFYCRAVPAQNKQHELAEDEDLILVKSIRNKIARQVSVDADSSDKCGDPPSLENGFSTVTISSPFAKVANFKCNEGYIINGNTVLTCEDSWDTSKLPNCTIINCGQPSEPTHGSVKYVTTTYESVANYVCKSGYDLIGNSSSFTCQINGNWSGSANCEISKCKAPPATVGGSVQAPSLEFGSTATYKCDEGHNMTGDAEIMCKENKEWSGPAPTCIIVECDAPPEIKDGSVIAPVTTYNSVATYTCNPGCIQTGEDKITCGMDGKWIGSPPTCTNPIAWTGDKFDSWFPHLVGVDFYKLDANAMISPIHNLSYEIMVMDGMKDQVPCIDLMHFLLIIPEVMEYEKKDLIHEHLETILGTYILRNPISLKDARALHMKLPEIVEKLYEPVENILEYLQRSLDQHIAGISLKTFNMNIRAYFVDLIESGKPVKTKEFLMYILKIVTQMHKIIDVHLRQTNVLVDCADIAKELHEPIRSMKTEIESVLSTVKIEEIVLRVTNLEPAVCEMVVDPFIQAIKQDNVLHHFTSTFSLASMMINLVTTPNANPAVYHWSTLKYFLYHPFDDIIKTFRAIEKVWPIEAAIFSTGISIGSPLQDISEDLILKLSSAIYPNWRYHNGKPENECERIRDSISVFLGTMEMKRFNYSLDGMFETYSKEFISAVTDKYPDLDSRLKEKVKCRVDKVLAELYITKMSTLVTKIKHDIDTRPYEKLSYNMATLISRHRPKDLRNLLIHIAKILDIYVHGSSFSCSVSKDLLEELCDIVKLWDDPSKAEIINQVIKVQAIQVLNNSCVHDEGGSICIDVDETMQKVFTESLSKLMYKVVLDLKKAILDQLEADNLETIELFISKDIALSLHHELKKIEVAVARVPIL